MGSFSAVDSKATNGTGGSSTTLNISERMRALATHFNVRDFDKLAARDKAAAIKKAANTDTFEDAWAKYEREKSNGKPAAKAVASPAAATVHGTEKSGSSPDRREAPSLRVDGTTITVHAAPPVVIHPEAVPPEFVQIATNFWHGLLMLVAGAAIWALVGKAIVKLTGG